MLGLVLGWMKIPLGELKTDVFHRIQDTINRILFSNWRYVNTNHNPADLVSRGICPEDFCRTTCDGKAQLGFLSHLPGGPDALILTGKLRCQN